MELSLHTTPTHKQDDTKEPTINHVVKKGDSYQRKIQDIIAIRYCSDEPSIEYRFNLCQESEDK